MARIIHIDSRDRDRGRDSTSSMTLHNITNFTIGAERVSRFFQKTVKNGVSKDDLRAPNFMVSMKVIFLVLPYIAGTTDNLHTILLRLVSREYGRDDVMYSTTQSITGSITHPLEFDKVQTDNGGTKRWIHFKSSVTQVYRFTRNTEMEVGVFLPGGTRLSITDNVETDPIDETKQMTLVIEAEHYINDADFRNQHISPVTDMIYDP
jgi:hypothetical protein